MDNAPNVPDLLAEQPADYPRGKFRPLHPRFAGHARVHKAVAKFGGAYHVDLDIGECECNLGQAWVWDYKTNAYQPNQYCAHKIKFLAAIVKRAKEDPDNPEDLLWPYIKALATRYNRFEVVSAFHKELRRGDTDRAWFWASILSVHRGLRGVWKYLLSILYEETRDHALYAHLVKGLGRQTLAARDVHHAVALFCQAKKKWQLPHRMGVFEAEMRAYGQLADKYGDEVAKPQDIIPNGELSILKLKLSSACGEGDKIGFQYALKGLQKLKVADLQAHRRMLLDQLAWLGTKHATPENDRYIVGLRKLILDKAKLDGIHYHEINAVADLLMGEPYEAGVTPKPLMRAYLTRPHTSQIPLGKTPHIPLYAHDNHTWAGKGMMRRFPAELLPKAQQTHLDFRWCGAYMGVAWRLLAGNQYGSPLTNVTWGEVEWPKWMYNTTKRLFY